MQNRSTQWEGRERSYLARSAKLTIASDFPSGASSKSSAQTEGTRRGQLSEGKGRKGRGKGGLSLLGQDTNGDVDGLFDVPHERETDRLGERRCWSPETMMLASALANLSNVRARSGGLEDLRCTALSWFSTRRPFRIDDVIRDCFPVRSGGREAVKGEIAGQLVG